VRAVVLTVMMIGLFAMPGCQRSEGRYLEREVTAAEVVGTWQMNPASVQDLRDVGYTGAIDPARERIVLHADGTCVFDTRPPSVVGGGRVVPKEAVACRWKLDTPPRQMLILAIAGNRASTVHYLFDESQDGRLIVWQYIDDPDAWRYVEYLKQ
jgi:hypothetical protein